MTYPASIIPNILDPDSSTLFIGAPSSGLSALSAYVAASISSGQPFFDQPSKPRPVAFFGDGFTGRYVEARKILDSAPAYVGLHHYCAGCGSTDGTMKERVEGNIESVYDDLDRSNGVAIVFDGIESCLFEPKDELDAATVISAATALHAAAAGNDYSLIATLHALPADLLLGSLRPLCGLFDRIVHVELVGASGRLTVTRDRLGPSGFRRTFDLVSPEIGTDADGGSVRGAAICPDLTRLAA